MKRILFKMDIETGLLVKQRINRTDGVGANSDEFDCKNGHIVYDLVSDDKFGVCRKGHLASGEDGSINGYQLLVNSGPHG